MTVFIIADTKPKPVVILSSPVPIAPVDEISIHGHSLCGTLAKDMPVTEKLEAAWVVKHAQLVSKAEKSGSEVQVVRRITDAFK